MNPNFTEQQNRLKTVLFQLAENAKGLIKIEFCSLYDAGSSNKTSVVLRNGAVNLLLVEPQSINDLNEWGEKIIKAEELCGQLEKEKMHEFSSPNFYKAITSEFYFNERKQHGL